MSSGSEAQVVIRVEGVFDAAAAQRLSSALDDAHGEVRVDLADVREFQDVGLAVLARALAGRSGVEVSGLRQHQLRLLRYLGIDAGPVDVGAPVELQ